MTARRAKTPPAENPAPEPTPKKRRRLWLALGGALVIVIALGVTYISVYANRLPPRTAIANVAIGGLTFDEAHKVLADRRAQFLADPVHLLYNSKTWDVKPGDIGTDPQLDAALSQVWSADKQQGWKHSLNQLFTSMVQPRNFEMGFVPTSGAGQDYFKKNVLQQIETPYQEVALTLTPGHVTVVPGKAGEHVDQNQFESDLYQVFKNGKRPIALQMTAFSPELNPPEAEAARQQADAILASSWKVAKGDGSFLTIDPKDVAALLTTTITRNEQGQAAALNLGLNTDALKKSLTAWKDQISVKAVNARVAMDNGNLRIVQDGKNGIDLDVDSNVATVSDQLLHPDANSRTITPKLTSTLPDVRSETLDGLGIKQLIGAATTDFAGSPTNRGLNIAKGQSSLNGLVVPDGSTFSTVGALGPIEESTGYLPELVILGSHTVPEAGGGLCQVSTTLFRSVLNAGLPIVERTNHAYRVGYYERGVGPGLDATIYDPSPDFKWKNDTGHAVLVQSYIKGTQITFEIYGTSDGRVSNVGTPTILETYPVGAPIYTETDSLDKGVTKQTETAHDGAKTTVDYVVTRNGQQINKQTFVSVYQAWPAQFLVGTHDPAATPSPAPAQ